MLRRSARLGLVAVTLLLTSHLSLRAQVGTTWADCKTDGLSTFNCARYYTGTVSLASELKTPNGTDIRSVVATITAGKVACRVKTPDGPAFEGAGMLVVEHSGTGNAGKYSIKVGCPEEAGKRPTRDDYPAIDTYEQTATNYAALEGKDAHEHPDADAANGVTGTETVTWSLRR